MYSYVLLSFNIYAGKTKDYNAEGFSFYQKKQYQKAHELFNKAVKLNPKNAFAWLNLARTTAVLNAKKEPHDYCQYEKNWIFKTLNYLTRAVELDPTNVLPKIAQDQEGLKSFKTRAEFFRWNIAQQLLPKSDSEIKKWIENQKEWTSRSPGALSQFITLETNGTIIQTSSSETQGKEIGNWKVSEGRIIFTLKNKAPLKFIIEKKTFYFNEGQSYFFFLGLKEDSETRSDISPFTGDFEAGFLTEDCS